MANLRCPCGKPITRREKRLNAGLCDKCFAKACAATAREIAKGLKKLGTVPVRRDGLEPSCGVPGCVGGRNRTCCALRRLLYRQLGDHRLSPAS